MHPIKGKKAVRIACILLSAGLSWNSGVRAGNEQGILGALQAAKALEDSGEWVQAKQIYESLLRQVPDHPLVAAQFFNCCLNLRQFDEALAFVGVLQRQENANSYWAAMRGRVLFKMGRGSEALREWNRLLASDQMNEAIYRTVANAMIQEKLYDDAAAVFLQGRKKLGKRDCFAVDLADLYEAATDYVKAAEEWLRFLDDHPEQADMIKNRLSQFPKTEAVTRKIIDFFRQNFSRNPDRVDLLDFYMQYCMQTDRFDEALRLAKESDKKSDLKNRGFFLLRFAEQALQSGAYEQSRAGFESLLKDYPDFPQKTTILIGLAQCCKLEGRVEDAVNYYYNVIQENPRDYGAMQALYEKGCLLRDSLNDWNGALETFQRLANAFPSAPQRNAWMLEIGDCQLTLGNLAEAETLFKNVLQTEQKKTEGNWLTPLFFLARTLYFEGRFQESMELLKTLSTETLNPKLCQDRMLNDALDLRLFLTEYAEPFPACVRLYARAEFLEKQSRLTDATASIDSLLDEFPSSPILPLVYLKKAEILYQTARFEESKSNLNAFLRLYPNHVEAENAALMLGKIEEKTGHDAEALSDYDKILRQYPHGLAAEEARAGVRKLQEKQGK
jgi:tetratricopeptide (TPR) repeat protein